MYPRFLEIEITGACPYACKHCYGKFPRKGSLSLARVYEIISQARGLFDCLIFSGGEPFFHPDLNAMIHESSKDFVTFITTTGYGMNASHVASIQHKAVLVFGLDGIGETHDLYRGAPGAFDTLMHAMEMTRALPKEIIVTLWTGVISQIDSIISLAEQHNAIVHFNALIPVGRARQNKDIMPEASVLPLLYDKLHAYKKSGGGIMTDLYKISPNDRLQGIGLFCRHRFNITPEGNVRPCEFHDAVLGNIYKMPLREIIARAQTTELIRKREQGFKDCMPEHMDDFFDYHTQICHRLATTPAAVLHGA